MRLRVAETKSSLRPRDLGSNCLVVSLSCCLLNLSPNHFVYDTNITLDDLDNLGADILIGVVGYGSAVVAIADEFDCRINRLKEALSIDAREDESCFVERLGTLG